LNLNEIKEGIVRESPTILTAFGVTGVITTTILAVRATPKALELIEAEAYRHKITKDELELKEKVRVIWPVYVPAGISATLTITCILGANSIHAKRNAAIAGLYSVATEALREYQEKVIETIGEKKAQKIKDAIAQDILDANPLGKNEVIIAGGDALFYDKLSGRYFKSSVEKIRKSQNDFNFELLNDMFKSVNEWYDMIGLPAVDMGSKQGWDVENGQLDIQFSTMLAENQEPCIVLTYSVSPRFC
jgi:hypothetical protein